MQASPEAVYDLISDVTRMGEWSPECHTCVWVDGDPGTVGARFKGSNKQGIARWSTTATVTDAERGKTFAFVTKLRGREVTAWRYELRSIDGDPNATEVTESYDQIWTPTMVRFVEMLFMRNREEQLEAGIRTTLARIKAAVEQ